jgi:hypothetical protein
VCVSQLEVDQLKLRIGSLQESLSYHRVAADRIQSLEASLAREEGEKEAALEALERTESRRKRSEYVAELRNGSSSSRSSRRRGVREDRMMAMDDGHAQSQVPGDSWGGGADRGAGRRTPLVAAQGPGKDALEC